MRGRDPLFDGRSTPPVPDALRNRIRSEIASALKSDGDPASSAWSLLWALVVLLSLAAHLTLDLWHRGEVRPSGEPLSILLRGGEE